MNPKIPLIKIRIAAEIPKVEAVVIPEVLVVAIPEVLPHQEAPAPVEAVPPAQRGAVQVAFPEAVVARELLPVAEAVQAER